MPRESRLSYYRKKSGGIYLLLITGKLNPITIHGTFPLPWVYKALQTNHSNMCFSLLNIALGYLQLVIEEGDIKKDHI